MSYLEGIGDEVVACIASICVLAIAFLFWVLREASVGQQHQHPANPPQVSPPGPNDNPAQEDEGQNSERVADLPILEEPSGGIVSSTSDSFPAVDNEACSSNEILDTQIPECEEDEETPSQLRQRRLEFFNKSGVDELPSPPAGKVNSLPLANGISVDVPLANGVSVAADCVAGPSPLRVHESTGENVRRVLPDANCINIRLKYLDDTERSVRSKPGERINDFKRLHFVEEARTNRSVRLINNGQVLQDTRTLESYGLTDNSVIHVQVLAQQVTDRRSNGEGRESGEGELDLGQFLWPILGLLLLGVWVMHFQYREYFTGASTVALVGLSGLFLTIVWGQYSTSRPTATAQ